MEGGAAGAVKGVGLGIAGAFAKPLSGLAGMASKVTEVSPPFTSLPKAPRDLTLRLPPLGPYTLLPPPFLPRLVPAPLPLCL
jgi:hypothetical protein